MGRIPFDLALTILTFSDVGSIAKFRLISQSFYRSMRAPYVWTTLQKYLITGTDLNISLAKRPLDGFFHEKMFFALLKALTSRDDICNTIRQSPTLTQLRLPWLDLGNIIVKSPFMTPTRRSSVFNLDGSIELKQHFIRHFQTKNVNFMHVLKQVANSIVFSKLSTSALLALLKTLADYYWQNNKHLHDKFFEPEMFLTLFYAMIGLEADFCRKQSCSKMSKREFIKACQCSYDRTLFDDELLGSVYDYVLLEGLNLGFNKSNFAVDSNGQRKSGRFLCYAVRNEVHLSLNLPERCSKHLEILKI